jgi:hypothetical protein
MTKRVRSLYAVLTIVLIGVFGYLFVDHLPGKPNPVVEKQPSIAMATMYMGQTYKQVEIDAKVVNGDIVISLAPVLEHKIVAFDYQGATSTIPLLAFINTDGKLVTAIRLCEPCNSKTFSIEGNELLCGNCETKWNLNNLDGLQGSCMKYPPDPIPSEVNGNEIHIKESLVRNWKIRI